MPAILTIAYSRLRGRTRRIGRPRTNDLPVPPPDSKMQTAGSFSTTRPAARCCGRWRDLPAYLIADFLALRRLHAAMQASAWPVRRADQQVHHGTCILLSCQALTYPLHARTKHEQPARFQQGGSQGNSRRVCSWSLGVGACTFRWRCVRSYRILIVLLLIKS